MRNKFSEMIEQGIASFEHKPLAPETPQTDYICREYNNHFSHFTNTYMSYIDGDRYITGWVLANEPKWLEVMTSCLGGAIKKELMGYSCIADFLTSFDLHAEYVTLNGDTAVKLTKNNPNQEIINKEEKA